MKEKISMIIRSSILLFMFFCSAIFQYIPFIIFHVQVSDYVGNMNMACLIYTFSDLILLALILCIYRQDIQKELSIFFKKIRKNLDTGFACWMVGLLIMFVSNSILISVFHAQGANNEIAVRSMIHSQPIVMGLSVCFLAPFIEEFVFRKTLKDVFKNPIIFVILSFLLFGVAHVYGMATSWIDWLYIIPYGSLGATFAIAYYKTDSIFTSMVFHMIHNTLVFLLILFIL